MVFRAPSSETPVIVVTPIEPSRVSPARRVAAILVTISLSIPRGVVYSAPSDQLPLSFFGPETTADATLLAQTETETSPPSPGGTANPQPGDIAPPDGVPVQAPFPAEAAPQALPGIPLAAGNCVITGEVSDATSLNPVPGAIIDAVGTGRSAETDASGKFRIDGLPPGTYTLEAAKLGYFAETSVVTAIETQPAEARFGLRLKPADDTAEETTLEEETIVGEYQGDSQGDLFMDLELGSSISSGLSKDDFTKTGVSDAAGAVGKISGANIVGGKYAVVRGLADRYVTTLFNGASISSADPSRKAVQLDIFPTTAIQSIDINKTYYPNLPGDFGGGTIQIKSLSIPDERVAEFKYKIGWNSTLDDRMLVHPDREIGFWGDVDDRISDSLLWNLDQSGEPETFNAGGNRVTPGNTNNAGQRQAQLNEGMRQQELANANVVNQRALHESQSFMPKETKPEAPEKFSLVYGDRFKFDNGNEAGFISAFQHSTSDEVNAPGEENRLTAPAQSWTEESYNREVDWSLYLGGGFKAGENHEFSAAYFKKHIVSDKITHGTDYTREGDPVFGEMAINSAVLARYGASAVYKKEFWTIDPVIRDTDLKQISGKHRNNIGTELSWNITKATSLEARPHSSTFQNGMLDFTDPEVAAAAASNPEFIYNPALGKVSVINYRTFVNDGNGTLDSSRETQFIEEDSLETSADITQNFYFSDDEKEGPRLELAAGGSKLTKEREQAGRIYLLRTASWERWVARNPPSWWTSNSMIAPFSPGSPLDGTTLPDGNPLPAGYRNLGEYLAANPDAIADYLNGYASENTGRVPGTGSGAAAANYVNPDAPYYLNGSGLEVRNVDSELTLTALYAAGTFHGDFWRFGGGARWEEETKDYVVAASPLTRLLPDDPARMGNLVTNAFIPSIVAGIDVVPEKSWANFAWSRTVARPTFFEFLPIESIDQGTGIVRRGNPNLTETSIDNLDLSVEADLSESFNARVSLFHKNLDDPIVVVQRVDLGTNINTYVNGDSGTISGIELEGTLRDLGPFSLTGNYTFIDSTLKYAVNQGSELVDLETRFPYQPGHILNLTLGWEPEESPWSAFLTANFTDEYPTILRSNPAAYDVWLKSQFTLDLRVARKFEVGNLNATLSLGVDNILGSDRLYEYRGGDVSGSGGELEGLVYSTEDLGRSFSIELKAAF